MSNQPNVAEFVSKRIERFNRFEGLCKIMSEDLKEMKYQVTQYEAKVQTYEKQILLKKADIAELDETIRRKKIEASGSIKSFEGDVNRREMDLVKRTAELEVRERNVKLRSGEVENLMLKVEKAIDRKSISAPAPVAVAPVVEEAPAVAEASPVVEEKRGRGRPKKAVTA